MIIGDNVSGLTVRTMLAVILENGLQMDDVISFKLSPETFEHLGTIFEINHVRSNLTDSPGHKELEFVFDLDDVTDD